jgi:DNA repair proteins
MDKEYHGETFMDIRKFSDIHIPVDVKHVRKRIQIVETRLVRKTSFLYDRRIIDSPKAAAELALKLFDSYDREYFYAVYLTTSCEPICVELVSIGSLNATIISPKEIFRTALLCCSYGIIIYHNHPSGGVIVPSKEDICITKRLKDAGNLIGIKLLDHIIVTDVSYISLKEKGLI